MPLLAALSCAQDPALKAELADLRSEVRALREQHQSLERQLDRVTAEQSIAAARIHPEPAAAPARDPGHAEGNEVPELTVVKLKPRAEPAPRLPTAVPVMEPTADMVEALASAAPEVTRDPSSEGGGGHPESQDASLIDADFNRGVEALRTGNLAGGVARLLQFANENRRHPKADNALYFAGVGQMGLDEHAAAARNFERLLKEYPAGDAVVDALLKLAECRLRLNQPRDARALYGEVINHYPGTAAASAAEARLASLP